MTDERSAAPGVNPLLLLITVLPAFVGYKVVEGMATGAGFDRWPSIGLASLGALTGASLGGLILYLFIRGRKPVEPPL